MWMQFSNLVTALEASVIQCMFAAPFQLVAVLPLAETSCACCSVTVCGVPCTVLEAAPGRLACLTGPSPDPTSNLDCDVEITVAGYTVRIASSHLAHNRRTFDQQRSSTLNILPSLALTSWSITHLI